MTAWIHQRGNSALFSKYCNNRTPITIVDAEDPTYRFDCIPISLTGEAYQVIIDEDNNRYGLKRGQWSMGDPEDIGDVIVREG